METNNNDTAAWASIDDVWSCTASVDAQVRAVLGRVMAQRRSVEVAFGYLSALAPGVKANCWSVAEEAGHEGPHRMQALLGAYRWDWKDLRGELPALAAAWLPCDPGDLIGPGIAVDETAQLKHGDATACVAPQHAGCTGQVENCVTTVFSAYVTTSGQAWADFDVYMPDRWARDPERRRAAGIPEDLAMTTKPELAAAQVRRLAAAGLPAGWAAFDEVYTRSGKLRETCEKAGLAYVGILPCDFLITLPSGAVIRADQAVKDAVFERRSCGTGTKGPRLADWALTATASPRHFLLIRRLISRPGQLHVLPVLRAGGQAGDDAVLHRHRRAPLAGRGNVQNGKGRARLGPVPGPELGRRLPAHRAGRARPAPPGRHPQRPVRPDPAAARRRRRHPGDCTSDTDADVDDADLRIPLGDAPVPAYPGQPRPRRLGLIRLSVAETARLARLAADWAAGLLTLARLAFRLRWSAWRRRHQAAARWYHHAARLAAAAT